METETIGGTVSGVVAEQVIDVLADTQAKAEATIVGYKLRGVKFEGLVNKLGDMLAKEEAESLGNILGNADAEALVDTPVDTSEEAGCITWKHTRPSGRRGISRRTASHANRGGGYDSWQHTW